MWNPTADATTGKTSFTQQKEGKEKRKLRKERKRKEQKRKKRGEKKRKGRKGKKRREKERKGKRTQNGFKTPPGGINTEENSQKFFENRNSTDAGGKVYSYQK